MSAENSPDQEFLLLSSMFITIHFQSIIYFYSQFCYRKPAIFGTSFAHNAQPKEHSQGTTWTMLMSTFYLLKLVFFFKLSNGILYHAIIKKISRRRRGDVQIWNWNMKIQYVVTLARHLYRIRIEYNTKNLFQSSQFYKARLCTSISTKVFRVGL